MRLGVDEGIVQPASDGHVGAEKWHENLRKKTATVPLRTSLPATCLFGQGRTPSSTRPTPNSSASVPHLWDGFVIRPPQIRPTAAGRPRSSETRGNSVLRMGGACLGRGRRGLRRLLLLRSGGAGSTPACHLETVLARCFQALEARF